MPFFAFKLTVMFFNVTFFMFLGGISVFMRQINEVFSIVYSFQKFLCIIFLH